VTRAVWQSAESESPDADVMAFLAGEDVVMDRALFVHDIRATRAHVGGLMRIGVLNANDARALEAGLDALADEHAKGTFVLDARFEDGHSAIEAYLTAKLGDAGKRVHTGRSRNDQVLAALRSFARASLETLTATTLAIARALLARVDAIGSAPMPGYTHLQRAVPSTVGYWLAGLAESFVDDAELARATWSWLDASPLGTAAGYGVNLPLDRDGVARDLGLSRLVLNGVAAQNARGKAELAALNALGAALLDLRRFAWDLSLFTTEEFAFVRLPDALTTGSSLMPNKRNPDVVELMRAAYPRCAGAQVEIASVLSLPSGYHRDLQATKAPFVDAMTKGLAALALGPLVVRGVTINAEKMRAAINADMYATDRAVEAAAAGTPFREAYRAIKSDVGNASGRTPEESLAARVSPGAHAAPRTEELRARLDALASVLATNGN
jgi:argininosuccinate lyase